MSMPRYAARMDANQAEICRALRKAGAKVTVIRQPVDLRVQRRGKMFLAEVKDGRKPPSARHLTPQQEQFIATWTACPVVVVTSVDEALAALEEHA